MITDRKRRIHFVLSTHWDREWRETFQEIRYALVRLMDRVLAGLEDARLKGPFQTDGQSIMIDDYLEIRPERREQIEKLIRERKLVLGPWYTMPDEFTVSGESLIRNLRLGREIARGYGGTPSGAGFVPDMFGHNSQLPQIFAGFNIRGGFIWRGTNLLGKRHVQWRGADGTTVSCYRFGPLGYCDFCCKVRQARQGEPAFDPNQTAARLEEFLRAEAKCNEVDPILIFDGGDHLEWDQQAYAVLAERMKQDDDFEIVHTCLDDYLAEMLPQADRISTILEGELRAPGRYPGSAEEQWVIPGVLASRVRLKQANSRCQALLCLWAEPFSALAHGVTGWEYPQGFLQVAWRWLLQNHAHDSIDGCSTDQVHKDMEYRFDQCRLIADKLAVEATSRIAASVQGGITDEELRVAVFNPLPREFHQVAELTLEIPTDWPSFNEFFGFEPKPAFLIHDADGKEMPYQRLGQVMNRLHQRIHPARFPQAVHSHHVKIALLLSIPALGYTTLTVRAIKPPRPTRYPDIPGLAASERSMANEHLVVQIESNGTLTLTDKRTGRVYSRLLTFEDCADIGDGWYHGVAVNDQAFVSTACKSDVALVHNGPMLTTFRIRTTLSVPEEFRFDGMTRSDRLVELVIDSLVSLRPGQDHVDIETTVQNSANDHRLRVLLPSGVDAGTYLADSPFDVVERSIPLRRDNHEYRELEVETKPQQSWTAVFDTKHGLGVVGDGLLETAVRDTAERPIALTLFRGTRRTIFTNGEPGGQSRGPMTFRYGIVPLAGKPDRTRLCELGQQMAGGLRVVQLRREDIAIFRSERSLPATAGLLRIDGPAVVSSVRRSGEGLEVRIFNPHEITITATIVTAQPAGPYFGPPTGRIQMVDFESNPVEELGSTDGKLAVVLKPKRIVTLRFT